MAKNVVGYEGRINNKTGDKMKLMKTKNGKGVIELQVAEQFQERNDRAPQKYKDPAKPADAYVNTETKWHRIQIWGSLDEGSELMALATSPDFNHGAILEIWAGYRSQGYVRRRDNVEVQDDRESIFLDGERKNDGFDTSISIKTTIKGTYLRASEGYQRPIHVLGNPIPDFGGQGGAIPAPEYRDDEGF